MCHSYAYRALSTSTSIGKHDECSQLAIISVACLNTISTLFYCAEFLNRTTYQHQHIYIERYRDIRIHRGTLNDGRLRDKCNYYVLETQREAVGIESLRYTRQYSTYIAICMYILFDMRYIC